MGTNYYIKTGKKHMVECYACGHKHYEEETIHIGKSSCGRYFTLHGIPEKNLMTYTNWKKFLEDELKAPGARIVNEYGDEIQLDEMKKLITREDYKSRRIPGLKKGDPVNRFGDIVGKKGLVYTEGSQTYPDGLYVVLTGDFS